MKPTHAIWVIFFASLFLAGGFAPAHGAGDAAEFYRGKAITWVVSSEPGGSNDILTRILVPYLTRETGARVVVVKNMGLGSTEGNNWVYNKAKKDGLTLVSEGAIPLMLNDLLKAPGVRYDTRKYNFLTAATYEMGAFAISPKLEHKTLDALRKAKGLRVGATSAKGYIALCGAVMMEILGLDGHVITGYRGLRSAILGIAQGELDLVASSESPLLRAHKDGNLITLFIMGDQRSPLAPEIPTLQEAGVRVPEHLQDAYDLLTSKIHGRAVALPPGVPPERVAFLRQVFKKIGESQDLQRDIVNWSGLWRPFIPGDELQRDIEKLMSKKDLGRQMDGLLKKYTAVR